MILGASNSQDSNLLTQLFTGTFTLGFNFRLRLGHDFSVNFLFCLSFRFVQNLRAAFVCLLDDYLGFRFRFFQWSVALAFARSRSLCARSAEARPSAISFDAFDGCH